MKLSFSSRVTLYVMTFTALLFVATYAIIYYTAHSYLLEKTIDEANGQMEIVYEQINNIQENVETIGRNMAPIVEKRLDDTAFVKSFIHEMLDHNPVLSSVGIAYERGFFQGTPSFLDIAFRDTICECGINHALQGIDNYGDYFCMDWFQIPYLLGKPYWAEPYTHYVNKPTISYLVPLKNKENRTVAVLALDLSLYQIAELVHQNGTEDKGVVLLGRRGDILVAPDRYHIMRETLFSISDLWNEPRLWEIGKRVINGEAGIGRYQSPHRKDETIILYEPLKDRGYSVAIILEAGDIWGDIYSLSLITMAVLLCGLLLVYLVFHWILLKLTHPLWVLKESTERIAKGNFNSELPQLKHDDVIKDLCNSFAEMQVAIQDKIVHLEQAEYESEQTKMMLAEFIQSVGMSISVPMNSVIGFSDIIKDMTHETNEDIKEYAGLISENCKQTNLILSNLMNLAKMIEEKKVDDYVEVGLKDVCEAVWKHIAYTDSAIQICIKEKNEDLLLNTEPMKLELLLIQLSYQLGRICGSNEIVLDYEMLEKEVVLYVSSSLEVAVDNVDDKIFTRIDKSKINDSLKLNLCHVISQILKIRMSVEKYDGGCRFVLRHPR